MSSRARIHDEIAAEIQEAVDGVALLKMKESKNKEMAKAGARVIIAAVNDALAKWLAKDALPSPPKQGGDA